MSSVATSLLLASASKAAVHPSREVQMTKKAQLESLHIGYCEYLIFRL